MEYGFGAHDFPVSGVFEVEPKSCPGFIFRCSIPLGHIKMPPSEFRTFIESVASEYHGDTYQLITKNCNHFTDDIVYRMTGKHIPGWVNRLAWLGLVSAYMGIFLGLLLIPLFFFIFLALEISSQPLISCFSPSSHREEDGTESLSTTTHEPTESDDADQDKLLLSPSAGNSEVSFVKEVQR
ncbi:hypothetical protein C3L33_03676, partial [Rhododendron williamsianum]